MESQSAACESNARRDIANHGRRVQQSAQPTSKRIHHRWQSGAQCLLCVSVMHLFVRMCIVAALQRSAVRCSATRGELSEGTVAPCMHARAVAAEKRRSECAHQEYASAMLRALVAATKLNIARPPCSAVYRRDRDKSPGIAWCGPQRSQRPFCLPSPRLTVGPHQRRAAACSSAALLQRAELEPAQASGRCSAPCSLLSRPLSVFDRGCSPSIDAAHERHTCRRVQTAGAESGRLRARRVNTADTRSCSTL